jgi:hypothetical protein
MNQVLLHLSFWNREHPSQLIAGQRSLEQKIDEALPKRAFRKLHVPYGKGQAKEMPEI